MAVWEKIFSNFYSKYGMKRSLNGLFLILVIFVGACFLEFWKRYAAEIKHRWDLSSFDIYEEHPRPEYLARLKHVSRKEFNVVTNKVTNATMLNFGII